MRTILIFAIWLAAYPCAESFSQTVSDEDPLERYIAEGFKNNIVLQQKNISLDRALVAFQTAKSMFLPSVVFQGNYQTADGGRNIPLPLGDLLNGAYATLNQLTGTQNFPQLQNESITFLPKNFYDAKVRTTVPIINTDIVYNKKISEQQIHLRESEVDTYRRELVKNIKSAYYNYLNALQAIDIYRSALDLAKEGKRVNEKLLESGKGLPAYILRSSSEIASAGAQLTQAIQQAENAKLYFNSLLNRPGEAAIDSVFDADKELLSSSAGLKADIDITQRDELKSLNQVIRLNETVVKMNRNYAVPKLSGFLDLGSQSENWKFNGQSRYYLAGLQLDIPLFAGNRNQYKISQSGLDLKDAELNFNNIQQQLELSGNVARNNLRSAWEVYKSSMVQMDAASTYHRLIERGYREGTNTYIETIDARNQLTSARIALLIHKYNVLSASAALERETAAYNLNNKNHE